MFNMYSKVFRSRGMKFVFALTILVIINIAGGSVIKTEKDDLIEVFKNRLAGELLQEVNTNLHQFLIIRYYLKIAKEYVSILVHS